MKSISAGMATHITQETTMLSTCWKVERTDGLVLGFTDHDRDIVYDGVTYKAETGFTRSNIESNSNLSVDQLDIEGLLSAAEITEEDLRAGLYDYADIYIFKISWADTTKGIVKLRRGHLGEVRMMGDKYIAELQGLVQRLSREILEEYVSECQADFGDTRCGFDTDTVKQSGTVNTVSTARRIFFVTGLDFSTGLPSYGLDYAVITWTSGLNNGLTMEVKNADSGTNSLELWLPSAFTISSGDTFDIIPGCDKRFTTCKFWGRQRDFRGFPDIRGPDSYLEYPDARA